MREWAIVTVQFSIEEQLRHRLADDVRPAEHQRLAPGQRSPTCSCSSMMQPSGVQGTHGAGQASRQPPAFRGWKPSTSLAGAMASSTLRVDLRRQRQLHEDAVHRGSALSRRSGRQRRPPTSGEPVSSKGPFKKIKKKFN